MGGSNHTERMLLFCVDLWGRLLAEEQGPEAAEADRGRHAPHHDRHGPRHDGRHLVGEQQGEERGETPYCGLQPWPVRRGASLQAPNAAQQEQEVGVGDDHEGHGRGVVPRAVHGRDGAVCQDGKSQGG